MRASWPPPITPSIAGAAIGPGRAGQAGGHQPISSRHGACGFGLARAPGEQLVAQRRIVVGQHRHREQRGIGRAGRADGKGGHRHALGHLHDGMQRIDALQVAAGHRHAQHRHDGLGRQHAGQVRRAAGAGDDGLQPAAGRGFGIGEHVVGHAVRADHARFVRHAELGENLRRVLQGVPVAGRAHQHTDHRGCACHGRLRGTGRPPL